MATMREVAARAGVSVSTASIVLRGEAQMRKISRGTQEKVWEAARALGYELHAIRRPFRKETDATFLLSVYMPHGYDIPLLMRFLKGLTEGAVNASRSYDILLRFYQRDRLQYIIPAFSASSAAIVCNASQQDIQYLESSWHAHPVVIHNCESDMLCSVNVDAQAMGTIPAHIFASRGHQRAVLLTCKTSIAKMDDREASFVNEALIRGLTVQRILHDQSMAGGFEGGQAILSMQPRPDCVFCTSDRQAIGLLRALNGAGMNVPEDLEIICVGDSDSELQAFASTSLSVIDIPLEQIATLCLAQAMGIANGSVRPPQSIRIPIAYHERDSCGQLIL